MRAGSTLLLDIQFSPAGVFGNRVANSLPLFVKPPSALPQISRILALSAQFLWPCAALRTADSRSKPADSAPHPIVAGVSGDYRGSEHQGRAEQKLYLQQTPAGLLFDLDAFESHPKRILQAEHKGIAKKVAEHLFVEEWQSEDHDGNPAPALFCIAIHSSGEVEVSIRGTVARNPPFYTERNLEGTYRKVGPEAEIFDEPAHEAVALLRSTGHPPKPEPPSRDDGQKAARLLGGGDALSFALFRQKGYAAEFAVDVCSAKQGNEYALQTVLMTLGGVRGGMAIDPGFALAVYEAATSNNPDLHTLYEDRGTKPETSLHREFALIKLAAACPPLDVEGFLRQHAVPESSLDESPYAIWQLAEDAAKGKRFGKPNAELAFQLVLRGGGSFDERAAAIRQSHAAWKSAGKQRFSLESCLSSPAGIRYLKQRNKSKPPVPSPELLRKEIRNPSAQVLLEKACEAHAFFISENARIFCGDEGFYSWEANSAAYRTQSMSGYLEMVRSVLKGFKPKKETVAGDADLRLNAKYKRAIECLGNAEAMPEANAGAETAGQFFYRDAEALKKVQRAWLAVRDKSALLFHELSPAASVEDWKAWLTETRTNDLPSFKEPPKAE